MDIFDLDSLLAQLILGLGAALVIGNGFALVQAKRGMKPKGAEGDLRRGRAWFLLAVGLVIALWGATSLLAGGSDPEPATTPSTTAGASRDASLPGWWQETAPGGAVPSPPSRA